MHNLSQNDSSWQWFCLNQRPPDVSTYWTNFWHCTSSSLPFDRWAQVFHQQRKWPHPSQNVIIFSSITFKVKFGLVTSSLSWIIRCMFYYFNSFTLNQTTPWTGVKVIYLKLLLCVSLLVIAKLHSKQYNIIIVHFKNLVEFSIFNNWNYMFFLNCYN